MSKNNDEEMSHESVAAMEAPPLPSEDTKPPDMPFFLPEDENQGQTNN